MSLSSTTPPESSSSPLRSILAAVALTVVAVLASMAGSVVLAIPLLVLQYDVTSPALFLGLTAAGQLVFIGVTHLYRRRRDGHPVVRIEGLDARTTGIAVGAAILAILLATAFSLLLSTLGLLPSSVIGEAGISNPVVYLGLAALTVVLIAPAEEYLFRGAVQGRLRETFGPVGAVVGSSLLFGSVHLTNYSGSVASVVAGTLLIAVTGAVLGAAYEYTKNLTVPIVIHALYNVTLLGLAYATV